MPASSSPERARRRFGEQRGQRLFLLIVSAQVFIRKSFWGIRGLLL